MRARGAVALALLAYGAGWVHGEHSGMYGRKAQRRQQVLARRAGEAVRDGLHEARVRGAKADAVMREVRQREVEVERRERAMDQHPATREWWQDWRRQQAAGLSLVSPADMVRVPGFMGVVGADLGDLAAGVDPYPTLSDVEQAVAAGFPPSPDDPEWGEPPHSGLPLQAVPRPAAPVWRLPEDDDEPGEPEDDPRMEALRLERAERAAEPLEPVTEDDVAQAAADLAALEPENDGRAREVLREAYDGG